MSKFFDAANAIDPALVVGMARSDAERQADSEGVKSAPRSTSLQATAFTPKHRVSIRIQSAAVLPFDGFDDIAAEHYKVIRTRLIQHRDRPRMICVSSGGMGDGKTINAINIAGALALKQDVRVLLVDCDFRRPAVAATLGISAETTLQDVLNGQAGWRDAVIQVAEAPNLHLIAAGTPTLSSAELLDSPQWRATCQAWREAFDFVILDSPPIGVIADYDLIQAVADGVVMVVRQDVTKRQAMMTALESIPKEKMLGVIMNCAIEWFSKKQGYYQYGYSNGPTAPAKRSDQNVLLRTPKG